MPQGLAPVGDRRKRVVPLSRQFTDMMLIDIVREKVERGLLPHETPSGAVRTGGNGQPCSACELTIVPADTQLAFELPNRGVFRFHFGCWVLWLATLVQLGASPPRANHHS